MCGNVFAFRGTRNGTSLHANKQLYREVFVSCKMNRSAIWRFKISTQLFKKAIDLRCHESVNCMADPGLIFEQHEAEFLTYEGRPSVRHLNFKFKLTFLCLSERRSRERWFRPFSFLEFGEGEEKGLSPLCFDSVVIDTVEFSVESLPWIIPARIPDFVSLEL